MLEPGYVGTKWPFFYFFYEKEAKLVTFDVMLGFTQHHLTWLLEQSEFTLYKQNFIDKSNSKNSDGVVRAN